MSGGGHTIPPHHRLYARAREPATAEPIEQVTAREFRRTWARHSPAAIAAAGRRLAADAAAASALELPGPRAMVAAGPAEPWRR